MDAGVTGPPGRRGREEVVNGIRRLVAGEPRSRFALDLGDVSRAEADAAVEEAWGWDPRRPRAAIDTDHTLEAARTLGERLRAVAAGGGRVALATGRPASLLPMLVRLGASAAAQGASVVELVRYGPLEPPRHPGRWLWWHEGVAVVSDGERLLPDETAETGSEWLFAVGRPDLVVADHAFAGAAATSGSETFALADLDAPALAVAAHRGVPVHLVPLDDRCPPAAYAPLVDVILATPSEDQQQHSTTRVVETYAPADCGGKKG